MTFSGGGSLLGDNGGGIFGGFLGVVYLSNQSDVSHLFSI